MSKHTRRRQRELELFMKAVPEEIRAACLQGYRECGRGALVFLESDPGRRLRPGMARAMYLSLAEAEAGPGWPDEWSAERVRKYDPQREFVVVFVYTDNEAYTFKGHFERRDDRNN